MYINSKETQFAEAKLNEFNTILIREWKMPPIFFLPLLRNPFDDQADTRDGESRAEIAMRLASLRTCEYRSIIL